jgi:hypothetical protein
MSGSTNDQAKPEPEAAFPPVPTETSSPPSAPAEPPARRWEPSVPPPAAAKKPPQRVFLVATVSVLLGLVVGAAAGHFVRKAPVFGRHFWNFDDESMPEGTLHDGWSGQERDESGSTFRWCGAVRCTLTLAVGDDLASREGDVLMRVRTWPMRYPGQPAPQTIRLVINGENVAERAMKDVTVTEVFHIRPGLLLPGPNEVFFEFGYVKSPKEAGISEKDGRPLSAGFDWIELAPVPANPR